ncbi:helix-turn-helix transcriptional regulator [Mucilaginibacter sp. UR6-1]|uniref:helix-turn-helix domain-containing protein n=1 Tax=Mucilaginibacter sp. UR6-1 TaxID=1435643 RepID=UPI001E3D147A|nr:helix-turn-helix transcriptional regulator [Mucilaginibacter sp. UR6-1]MCC8409117.1 helix-turn-helix transcriptional regulator [Mucilaginibacter sp. UR6-1]
MKTTANTIPGISVKSIELFLDYSVRFYERQFLTRDHATRGVVERFEELLNEYFTTDKPQTIGLPGVAWCTEQLNLSPNYFGDLIKKETGKTAQEYIQFKLIDMAKEQLFDNSKSITQIAADLGFKYPQHFARLFKKQVGQTPLEYRSLN